MFGNFAKIGRAAGLTSFVKAKFGAFVRIFI
jgi:hypothetical protein